MEGEKAVPEMESDCKLEPRGRLKRHGNTGFYPRAEVVSLGYHKERATQLQII